MSFCTTCGAKSTEGAQFCVSCGGRLGQAAAAERVYAGFSRRYAAAMIDLALTGVAWSLGFLALIELRPDTLAALDLEIWTTLYFVVVVILYHSLLESWLGQTPGKRVAGIRVARPGGSPAGAVRAVGRNIFKLLSLFVLGLGFVIAAFTRQRRALHDMLGGTLVVDQGAVPASVTASGKTMKSSPVVLLFALAATAVVLTTPIMALDRLIQRQTVYRDARVPIGVDELGTRSPEEPSRLVVPFTRMQGNVDSHRVILESAAGAGRSDLVGR